MRILFKELMWLTLAVLIASSVGLGTVSSVKAQPPPCADLVITNFSISPAEPVVGQNATIDITVKNQGSCSTVVGFVVQWKSGRFAATGPSTFIPALNANQSQPVSFEFAFPTAGNFATVATVDTDNTVNETNENNNLEIKSATVRPDLPDLVVTDFTINPDEPVEGLNATINITIENQGTKPAGPFVVQWKSDMIAPTGPTSQVPGLAAGASTTVSFEYAFPNDGNFTTVATVDSASDVQESNEDNNLEILPVTVQQAVIDLLVTQFTVEPAPGIPVSDPPKPVQGRLTQVTITVKNQGNFPAGDFVVQWKPTQLSPDLATQVNGLGPGESQTVTFDHTYALHGEFTTTATVDSTHKVRETDEHNNSVSMSVTVEPPRPDLIITDLTINPAQPVRGLQATVTVNVKNRGNSPAGIFVVEWKPTQITPGLAKQINGLAVGQSVSVTFDYTYLVPGQFTSIAQVDSTHRVLELDEANNTKELPVTVLVDTVDLLITSMSIAPDPPLQGVPVTVSIQVKNDGNSPSGPFVLEWNPDAHGLITPSPSTLSSQIDDLAGGQTTTVNFQFTYPDAGTFRTVAEVDAFNNVRETNEDNNLKILNVVVEPSAPDLEITSLTMNPASPTQGAPVTVSVVVENQGSLSADSFIVEWYPDANGLITPGPATLSSQVNSLGVSQSETVEFDYIYPESGNFRTIAKADAFDDVAESNEANNLKILNVTVEPGIDLVITDFSLDPPSPVVRGSTVTASITVENQGIYPAGTFWVKWKYDQDQDGGPQTKVDGLNPGQPETVQIEGTFAQTGAFSTTAIVDVFDQVIESNENNNEWDPPESVIVEPRMTEVRVTFTRINVSDDSDPFPKGAGDIWLEFNINGQEGRYPNSGTVDIDSGDHKDFTRIFDVTIIESGPLVVVVQGFDSDSPDPDDRLGIVLQVYGANTRWGEGYHVEESSCPDGCYSIEYTIEILNEPPTLRADLGAEAVPPPEFVYLPDEISKVLPYDFDLPEGVRRKYFQFLPMISR